MLSFPLFNDEALLLGWSKMVAQDFSQNFTLSIRADGYPPLTTWIYALAFKIFSNPVFAGRFVSVLAGAFTAVGLYLLGRLLYSQTTGLIAAVFYIFVPMTFFVDRYAYHESLISLFGVYTLLFSLLILKDQKKYRPFYFLGLGLSMGVGVLSKTAAFLILTFPLISFFFHKSKNSTKKLGIIIFSYLFPALSYLWLFSDSYAWLIIKKGRDLSMGLSEILSFPFEQWKTNFLLVFTNLWYYLTFPLLVLLFYVSYKLIKQRNRSQLFLLVCFLFPLIFFFFVSEGRIHFKYLAFAFPPLLLAISYEIESFIPLLQRKLRGLLKNKKQMAGSFWLIVLLVLLLLLPSLRFDFYLTTNPYRASFEPLDYEIHLQGIFSGYKLEECAQYLQKLAKQKPLVVALPHPDIGVIFYGLPLLLENESKINFLKLGSNVFYYNSEKGKNYINLKGLIWPNLNQGLRLLAVIPDDQSEEWPELFLKGNPEAKLLKRFVKPGGKSSINIYEIPY